MVDWGLLLLLPITFSLAESLRLRCRRACDPSSIASVSAKLCGGGWYGGRRRCAVRRGRDTCGYLSSGAQGAQA